VPEESTLVVTVVALVLMLIGPAIGIWTARAQAKLASAPESALRFGTTITGLSASASGNSAFILIGAVGLGYLMGLSALWIPLGFWIGDIIFWYFVAQHLVRRVQETGVETISELISHEAGEHALMALRTAAVVVIIAVGLFCVAQFLAVGKILLEVFDLNVVTAMALAVFAGLMSVLFGGLGSSMQVNVYQSILMICAALILLVGTFMALPQDFSSLQNGVDTNRLLDPFYGLSPAGFVLFIISFILQGLLFAMCSPHVLSRITKGDVDAIPRIRWVYMGFMQSLWWLMTLVGVILALLGLVVDDPDRIGFMFAGDMMPPLLMGVFVAGIAAASMSTGEAQMLVIANALTRDIAPVTYQAHSPDMKRRLLLGGRIAVAGGLFIALTNMDLDLVGRLVIQAASLVLSGFAVPAILFILRKPVDGRVTSCMVLFGAGATLLTRLSFSSLPPGHEIYSGLMAAVVVYLVGSRLCPVKKQTQCS